jgi:hypothetical protein
VDILSFGDLTVAFVITAVLISAHLFATRLVRITWISSDYFLSFSAGISAAYVFLHMLPELVEGNAAIGKLLSGLDPLTPFLELAIFAIAMVGFVVYYALALHVEKESPRGQADISFRVAMLFYALLNFCVAYAMPLRVQTGLAYTIIFTVAIGLHNVILDLHLMDWFPKRYARYGRLILAGSLAAGWGVSAISDPIHVVFVALMIAFLSGAILYQVLGQELAHKKARRFPYFVSGIVLITVLLAMETWLHRG